MNLSNGVKITRVVGPTVAGTTTIDGTALDMQGYEGVVFVGSVVTAAVNNGIKAQQGQASNLSDAADLAGTAVLLDATKTQMVLDVYRPEERYVRCQVVRGTSTVIDSVWAIQYGARVEPVSNVTAAQAAELHVSPAEGTA
jgi:hypothetical protein